MKNRKPPSELVRDSSIAARLTWFTRLKKDEQNYIREVASEMRNCPDAAPYLVAEAIRAELLLSTSKGTVARTLKELMDEKT